MDVFFCHDDNIWPMLKALNIANEDCVYKNYFGLNQTLDTYECPYMDFQATLQFEIFKFNASHHGLRLAYKDRYYDVCNGHFLDAGQFICDIEEQFKVIDEYIVDDLVDVCLPKEEKGIVIGMLEVTLGVLTIFAGSYLIFNVIKLNKMKREKTTSGQSYNEVTDQN